MIPRKAPGILLALMTTLTLLLTDTAFAGKTKTPPTIDQIVGQYRVASKYTTYDFDAGRTGKGSYLSVFTITKVSDVEVQLKLEEVGEPETFIYRGLYANGILSIAEGHDTSDLSEWMLTKTLWFSGTSGKIKMSGRGMWYDWPAKHAYTDAFKGKMGTP